MIEVRTFRAVTDCVWDTCFASAGPTPVPLHTCRRFLAWTHVLGNTARKSPPGFHLYTRGADIREVQVPNHDVDQTERVRQHVRRIMNQLTRDHLKRSQENKPSLGPGMALRTRAGSRTFLDPTTGQAVTTKPKPRIKT